MRGAAQKEWRVLKGFPHPALPSQACLNPAHHQSAQLQKAVQGKARCIWLAGAARPIRRGYKVRSCRGSGFEGEDLVAR